MIKIMPNLYANNVPQRSEFGAWLQSVAQDVEFEEIPDVFVHNTSETAAPTTRALTVYNPDIAHNAPRNFKLSAGGKFFAGASAVAIGTVALYKSLKNRNGVKEAC